MLKDTTGIKTFTIGYVYEAIKNKKIISIDLNDAFNESEMHLEARKFNFITAEMERLQFTNDTTAVLRVQFGDWCTYGDFIWVLNYALVYDFKRYALVDNVFYFFPSPRFIPHIETIDLPSDDFIIPQQKHDPGGKTLQSALRTNGLTFVTNLNTYFTANNKTG